MVNRIKIYETLQWLTCFINCICSDPSVWQSVWGFTHLMQISIFKIEISLFINRDICMSM